MFTFGLKNKSKENLRIPKSKCYLKLTQNKKSKKYFLYKLKKLNLNARSKIMIDDNYVDVNAGGFYYIKNGRKTKLKIPPGVYSASLVIKFSKSKKVESKIVNWVIGNAPEMEEYY